MRRSWLGVGARCLGRQHLNRACRTEESSLGRQMACLLLGSWDLMNKGLEIGTDECVDRDREGERNLGL